MELQIRELDSTLEKLKETDDSAVFYQNVGSLLLKVDERKSLEDELNTRKETFSRRVNSMKEQEDRLKQRLESMGKELNEKLKNAGLA